MSEPKSRANRIEQILPGVFWWHVEDDRLGGSESDAYAVVDEVGRVVLIDPLPIREELLRELGEVVAIVLSASCHQRSAWRYRRVFGVSVYAPEGAVGLDEEPDESYSSGEALPNGLVALDAPGPAYVMYALWLATPRSTVFVSDLLTHDGSGVPTFIASEYQDDPERTRLSVRRLLERVPVGAVCFNHGPPILHDGGKALRAALAQDQEFPEPNLPAP